MASLHFGSCGNQNLHNVIRALYDKSGSAAKSVTNSAPLLGVPPEEAGACSHTEFVNYPCIYVGYCPPPPSVPVG